MVTVALPYLHDRDRRIQDDRGRSPFGRWFDGLDARTAARVRTALARHGGWVQRQRRVPHKRRPGLQSLFPETP